MALPAKYRGWIPNEFKRDLEVGYEMDSALIRIETPEEEDLYWSLIAENYDRGAK